MATSVIVLTHPQILIADATPTDLSQQVSKIEIQLTYDDVSVKAFGNSGVIHAAGLRDGSAKITFYQGYEVVDAAIWPRLGTVVPFTVQPQAGAASASNPKYSFSVLVSQFSPINGTAGSEASTDVQWSISGDITRAVS